MSKTQIYAHRGANRIAAENTQTAFDLVLQNGIDGMETDIQLSRDNIPVLWHDDDLGKLGMPDKHIDDFDVATMQQMNFTTHFKPSIKPEGVMRLDEFIHRYREQTSLLLEIKHRPGEPIARQQAKLNKTLLLAGNSNGNRILASSFSLPSMIYAHECKPDFPLVYNMEPEQTMEEAERVLNEHPFLHGICLHISRLDQAMVEMLRRHHKLVAVYTCNTESEIHNCLDLSVDILISDIPEFALTLRSPAG